MFASLEGRLGPRARDALRVVVDGHAAGVVDTLRRLDIDEPAFAVALDAGQRGLDVAPVVLVGMASERSTLLDREDPDDGWWQLWNPHEYRHADSVADDDGGEPPAAVSDAWAVLDDALEEVMQDLDEPVVPELWALAHVAKRLNQMSLPLPLTDDAVVYAFDEEFGDALIAQLQFVARPGVFAALRASGYVGYPDDE